MEQLCTGKQVIAQIQPYLDPITACIKKIDSGGSAYDILEVINQSMKLIVDFLHIVLNCKESPGSEDILPIWFYCLIQSAPKKLYSSFYFVNSLLGDEDRKGIYGISIVNLRAGVEFIENLNHKTLKMEENEFILSKKKNEIEYGAHRYKRRLRTQTGYTNKINVKNIQFF